MSCQPRHTCNQLMLSVILNAIVTVIYAAFVEIRGLLHKRDFQWLKQALGLNTILNDQQ